jgi:hypothetical protein
MFVLKLALLTCAFYLTAAICIEGALFALTHWRGGYGIYFSSWTGIAVVCCFFGAIWSVSFLIAFRIVWPRMWLPPVG